ncbi:MAG TPA: roadblock/LC7 domain-containing protein [bacterium]
MTNDYFTSAAGTRSVLTKEQFDRAFALLSDLAAKLRVSAVFLTDGTGRILAAKKSSGFSVDATVFSALTAASASATNEMARLLGEAEPFQMVLHEGRRRNAFVCSVGLDCFLIVVFDSGTALGMIRLLTKRAVEALTPVLTQPPAEEFDLQQAIGGDFGSLLGDELDRTFKERH